MKMAKTKNLLFALLAVVFLSGMCSLKAQTPDGGESIPPQEIVKSESAAGLQVEVTAPVTADKINVSVQTNLIQVASETSVNKIEASGESPGKLKNLYTNDNRKLYSPVPINKTKRIFPTYKKNSEPENSGRVKTDKQKATCRSGT